MSRNIAKQPETSTVRCAIYTRKSTEEGLDQDFNTLDAQREAGEAMIKSQKNEGWECLPELYDDGGFSGGNLERPAFKRLMTDIEAGKVDCVVVYKVDRLSRSLLDFARIMEVFDRHKVAFVSVTQQFNTAAPMGRLVLNVLLSFAQFEREIIGERIRDKIAAQRRKGKWTGGTPVLGYDVERSSRGPHLVVNPDEAKKVVAIYDLYLKLGSLLPVVGELENRGWITKSWTTKKGVTRGGEPFCKSNLYGFLTNTIYVGKIKHKTAVYQGEHPPLIEQAVFDRVQAVLQHNGRSGGGSHPRHRYSTPLKGLLHCKACDRTMVHTYTDRGTTRYRYYTCTHALHSGRGKCPSGSLPANEVEELVVRQLRNIAADADLRAGVLQQVRSHLEDELQALQQEQRDVQRERKAHHAAMSRLSKSDAETSAGKAADLLERITGCETRLAEIHARTKALEAESISGHELDAAFAGFDSLWTTLGPREQGQLMELLVARVEYDVQASAISISFHDTGIKTLAAGQGSAA